MTVYSVRTQPRQRIRGSIRRGRLGAQGARAAFLATGPTAWYDARDLLTSTQQTLTNRVGTSTATLGSTSGSDTNDPLALTHSGTSYVYLPGSASNYLTVPDAAALDITGDIDVRAQCALTSYASGAIQTLASKYTSAGQRSWILDVSAAGALRFVWSVDGTATVAATSTAAVTTVASAGATVWVRATLDVDNGASGYDAKFYTSSDGTTWTQLGATVTGGATTSIFSSTAHVALGAIATGTANLATGIIYRAIIKNGIDGTTVLDINTAVDTLGHASFTCTTGQTVTVNRSTSGLVTAVVQRPRMMFDGSDDYLALAAGDAPTFTAAAGNYTVMLVNRVHNLAGAATLSRVWSSESASAVGAHIYLDQTSAQYKALVGGASTTVATAAAAFTATTQIHAVAAVFAAGTVYAYSTTTGLTAGADYTGVGTVTHTTPRVASRADSVATPADFACYAVAHWTRALTVAELNIASDFLLGTYV